MSDFHDYLLKKAEEYGFGEPKKTDWVRYMASDEDRGRELLSLLKKQFSLSPGLDSRALDIGCGFGGQVLAFQALYGTCCGIEIQADRVDFARERIPGAELVCGSACKLPWPDEQFDLVISTDVLEHVTYAEQESVAAEIVRVLKPGGFGYVAVPNRFQLMDEHNKLPFGTWLPAGLRRAYVRAFSSSKTYDPTYERTRGDWRRLFTHPDLKVELVPTGYLVKGLMPPSRFALFLEKQGKSL